MPEPSWSSSRAKRVRKTSDRKFRAAIRGLQRDGAVRQGRAHLYDGPEISPAHPAERRHCAVDIAEIGDLGCALILGGRDLAEREHRPWSSPRSPTRRWDRARVRFDPPPGRRLRRRRHRRKRRRRALPLRRTSAAAASRPSEPRAIKPTEHPRFANARTVARPTPALAPVTTTTLCAEPFFMSASSLDGKCVPALENLDSGRPRLRR